MCENDWHHTINTLSTKYVQTCTTLLCWTDAVFSQIQGKEITLAVLWWPRTHPQDLGGVHVFVLVKISSLDLYGGSYIVLNPMFQWQVQQAYSINQKFNEELSKYKKACIVTLQIYPLSIQTVSIHVAGQSCLCNLMLLIPPGFFRMQTFSIWVNFTLRISPKPHYIFFRVQLRWTLGVMIRGKSVILFHRI